MLDSPQRASTQLPAFDTFTAPPAPPKKRPVLPVVLSIALGLALITSGVLVTQWQGVKGDLADTRATLNHTRQTLSEVRTDLAGTEASLKVAETDLADAEATVSSCKDAIQGLTGSMLFVGQAAKAYINAATAGLFAKLSYMQQGLAKMKAANAALDAAKPDINACQGGLAGTAL